MAVATKEDVVLKLSNGECIPNDHKVRRIEVYGKKGNEPRRCYDHPGVSRRICHFKLKTMDLFEIDNKCEKLGAKKSENSHKMVVKLLYILKLSRLDIQLPVAFLCTRVSCCDKDDWKN